MQIHIRSVLPLLAVSLIALPLIGTEPAAPPPAPTLVQQVRVKWEYRTETNINDRRMNELGAQGWEMVGFQLDTSRNGSRNMQYVFKRPKAAE